ncbi:hypothetical protein FBQ81_03365 [Chloroflexi bacterium CFX6]|nr:hypothetical protein [Chloroflexi bacterium CFX6]
MSTLAIPPKRVRLYRALWDRWIIVLRVLFDLGAGAHPVRWRHAADTLLIDKKTCQKYIAGLVRDGHLAVAGEGYMLTEMGMEFLHEMGEGEIPHLESGKIPGEKFSPLGGEVNLIESETRLTPPPSKLGKNLGETFSPLAQRIIAHIPDLFDGSKLILTNLPWTQDDFQDTLLLGWVAYAYEKRASLSAPVGLIYSKLKRDERPAVMFLENYREYLPDQFLDDIGLWEKRCPVCLMDFGSKQVYDEHFAACLSNGWESVEDEESEEHWTCEPDATVTAEVVHAWEAVLVDLQNEISKASFETWVRDTFPVHFADGRMQVATRNKYAQNWLMSRLCEDVNRQLTAILGRQIDAEFVIASNVAVETD